MSKNPSIDDSTPKTISRLGVNYPYVDPDSLPQHTIGIMRGAYNIVTETIKHHPERFTAREKKAAAVINRNKEYIYSFPSSISSGKKSELKGSEHQRGRYYMFSALPEELDAAGSPENYAPFAAHEFKHATLRHTASMGAINTHSVCTANDKISKSLMKFIFKVENAAEGLKDTFDNRLFHEGVDALRFLVNAPFAILSCTSLAVSAALSRKEETKADEFSLRVAPDVDPKELMAHGSKIHAFTKNRLDSVAQQTPVSRHWYREETLVEKLANKIPIANFFKLVKSDIFATHPNPEARLNHMTDYQQKLRSKDFDAGM